MSDPMYDRTLIEKCDVLASMKTLYRSHCAGATAGLITCESLTPRAYIISIGRLQGEIDQILKGKR